MEVGWGWENSFSRWVEGEEVINLSNLSVWVKMALYSCLTRKNLQYSHGPPKALFIKYYKVLDISREVILSFYKEKLYWEVPA